MDYLNSTSDKKASYHDIIDRDGSVLRMVPDDMVANHAGDSGWPNPRRATPGNQKPNGGSVNAESIGIAWAHQSGPLTAAQIATAIELVRGYRARYGIPLSNVVGHDEVSPGRKTDPQAAMPIASFRALLGADAHTATTTGQADPLAVLGILAAGAAVYWYSS